MEARATSATRKDVVVHAPAKINLWLHVVGRRSDGFHLLESLIAFADLADQLELTLDEPLSLEVEGPFAEGLRDEPDNLVLRAARGLARLADRPPNVRIRLRKNLPVAAGVGGGSADAAATIRGLCALWGFTPSRPDRDKLAAELGADVPICLDGRAAFVSGVGERIEPIQPLPRSPMVLVNPRRAMSTGAVFGALAGRFSQPRAQGGRFRFDEPEPDTTETLVSAMNEWDNDLSGPARRLDPAVNAVLEALESSPNCLISRMSGSGATCFGIYQSDSAATAAAENLSRAYPEWWIEASNLRSAAPAPQHP